MMRISRSSQQLLAYVENETPLPLKNAIEPKLLLQVSLEHDMRDMTA